ncbi:uncharacterized protein [Epargyreus clarus]|uniref:uncharacterized protein n=1 Tax=Epargyreus clarus TaxID=520877 RepID=UPI003C2D10DC
MANSDDFKDAEPIAMPEVLRVGVRIPPFWPEDPALWFAQIESQFTLSKITSDETKYCYLVGQLDHQYVAEVKDIISDPPDTDKYIKLKSELIKRLSASQEKRVKQLLMHEELGDRKPSQFLRHLQSLAGPSVPKSFIATIWSSRLPASIQTVIASQVDDLPLDKLSDIADKVHEIALGTPQIAASSTAVPSTSSTAYDDLAKEVCELRREVKQLSIQVANGRHSRSRTRSRNRNYHDNHTRSRSRCKQPPANHPLCFYHFNYGAKALKCKQPCQFKSSENSQGGRK